MFETEVVGRRCVGMRDQEADVDAEKGLLDLASDFGNLAESSSIRQC